MSRAISPPPVADGPVNPSRADPFAVIAERMLSRRAALRGLLAGAGVAFSARALLAQTTSGASGSSLAFTEVPTGIGPDHDVAPGYTAQVLIRWGDGVLADAPAFDVPGQTAASQARQFGYNNDFIGYFPLPLGSDRSDHGLLFVNHEYTEAHLMFPGLDRRAAYDQVTRAQVDVELAALGASVIEIRQDASGWAVVAGSRYARRITLGETAMALSGPAAGHPRLRTDADPTGTRVIGMAGNCGGGVTPWGTALTAEENINLTFSGDGAKTAEARNFKRYGFSARPPSAAGRFHDRFHVEKALNEANRFGWIVEIDPYDPASIPVKRTALGRLKHEAATVWVNPNGTITIYTGDDERHEYLYKFVSAGRYDATDRTANRDLLDSGTLYVARFRDDNMVTWLPLVFGQGPLTVANGFASQADVLIEARRAADLLAATPMDRPEDVETNPVTGRAYVVLTNNNRRTPEGVNKANPRPANEYGHIIELIVPGDGKAADHSVTEHRWDMFLMGGPVDKGGVYGPGLSATGWIACPDNIAFDNAGRIWICTDQGEAFVQFGIGDGIWAADTTGPGRATTRHFFRAPRGSEVSGPWFTPDCRTLFVSVQHPASDDAASSFATPSTRWPDFRDDTPPRPSVVAITKNDGGVIGS